jgi:hypothetical protein
MFVFVQKCSNQDHSPNYCNVQSAHQVQFITFSRDTSPVSLLAHGNNGVAATSKAGRTVSADTGLTVCTF